MATPDYQNSEKKAHLEAIRRVRRRLFQEANDSPVHADAASDDGHVDEPQHHEEGGSEHDIKAVHDHQHGETEYGSEGGTQTTDAHGDGKDWENDEEGQTVGDKADDRDERWHGEGDPRGHRNVSEAEDEDMHRAEPAAGASAGSGVTILRGSSRRRKVFHGRG